MPDTLWVQREHSGQQGVWVDFITAPASWVDVREIVKSYAANHFVLPMSRIRVYKPDGVEHFTFEELNR